jgi:hypothetical protein
MTKLRFHGIGYAIDKFTHPLSSCNVCRPSKEFLIQRSKDLMAVTKLGELIRECSTLPPGLSMKFQIMDSMDVARA